MPIWLTLPTFRRLSTARSQTPFGVIANPKCRITYLFVGSVVTDVDDVWSVGVTRVEEASLRSSVARLRAAEVRKSLRGKRTGPTPGFRRNPRMTDPSPLRAPVARTLAALTAAGLAGAFSPLAVAAPAPAAPAPGPGPAGGGAAAAGGARARH